MRGGKKVESIKYQNRSASCTAVMVSHSSAGLRDSPFDTKVLLSEGQPSISRGFQQKWRVISGLARDRGQLALKVAS